MYKNYSHSWVNNSIATIIDELLAIFKHDNIVITNNVDGFVYNNYFNSTSDLLYYQQNSNNYVFRRSDLLTNPLRICLFSPNFESINYNMLRELVVDLEKNFDAILFINLKICGENTFTSNINLGVFVNHFMQSSFSFHDTLRSQLWNDDKISPVILQNTYLFANRITATKYKLSENFSCNPSKGFNVIHPSFAQNQIDGALAAFISKDPQIIYYHGSFFSLFFRPMIRSLIRLRYAFASRTRDLILIEKYNKINSLAKGSLGNYYKKLFRPIVLITKKIFYSLEIHMLKKSAFFDVSFYRDKYSDLSGDDNDLFKHYVYHGWREGRIPSPLFLKQPYSDYIKNTKYHISPVVQLEVYEHQLKICYVLKKF